ncbi:aldehyde dehydrogenase (NAD+) [Oryzomicrobium terrae]|uniref:aldehyde dehydrogenase (NAD(+)) n=1 Tax=Oryzomicrobium terrae TaxID=1735038 RepID=A0A5C1E4A4_9RHOO|nr:aldehyde dehydrogenase family protein [Oryzomicrobium terrae]QEL63525.1 aldehyde dehydrogenase (NAD+) [Oryzomicrobium terrae]
MNGTGALLPRQLVSVNPASGHELGRVAVTSAEEAADQVAVSAAAFRRWREVPAPRRGLLVRAIADALRRDKARLAALVSAEVGKIRSEAEGEIQEMIDMADYAVGLSRQLHGLTLPSERPGHRLLEQWHPLGAVLVITAFNFPAAVWAWNAFVAAVCGDTVVWKPSSKAPLTAQAISQLVEAVVSERLAEVDGRGVFATVYSDEPATLDGLVGDGRLPLVSFTGSSATGRRVAVAVARRLGRSLLECSGNNAMIVDETADLELAAQALFFGAMGTAGQRCTSTRRAFVHRAVLPALEARLAAACKAAPVGDPTDPATLVGPLIDEAARQRFLAAVAAREAAGETRLAGGRALPGPGHFVTPALFRAEAMAPRHREEVFGPLLTLFPYDDFAAAIAAHNDVPQGLSGALFTRDLGRAERFLSAAGADTGLANVNTGTSGAEIGAAFGGEKDTGGGREAGSDSWKAYMRRQTNVINDGAALPLAQGVRFSLPGA